MYRMNNDIPTISDSIDQIVWRSNLKYNVKMLLLDIRYFKTFTSELITNILNLNDRIDDTENVFLNICLSSILTYSKNDDFYDIVEYTCKLLMEVFDNNKIPLETIRLKEQLYIYMDVLKNNIEFILDNYGLDMYERISINNIININELDRFYVIKDFTLNVSTVDTMSNTLCIKVYERI